MCSVCGREACPDCYSRILEGTKPMEGEDEEKLAARRLKHTRGTTDYFGCSKKQEHTWTHFVAVSRFRESELEQVVNDMRKTVQENSGTEFSRPSSSSELPITVQPDGEVVPIRAICRFKNGDMSEERFRSFWEKGEPLLVEGLLCNFKIAWTPEYFKEKHGKQEVLVIECQSEINEEITVEKFFEQFGKYEGRQKKWKLKDWPPSTDFKTAFPELYKDFSEAVPVPNYVRRDGVLNLSSHFPLNTVAPDLGTCAPTFCRCFLSTFGLSLNECRSQNVQCHGSGARSRLTGINEATHGHVRCIEHHDVRSGPTRWQGRVCSMGLIQKRGQ
jgi:[histone H3]-dimethyl-L-lysine9 demethylase